MNYDAQGESIMEKSTSIVELEQLETGLTYFSKVEAGLSILEEKYAVVPDATTLKGKEEIRKGLAEMRPLRTTVDKRRLKLGKKLRQDLKDINTIGNRIIDRIKIVEDPYKIAKIAAEKAEIEAEANRVADIKARIQMIAGIFETTDGQDSEQVMKAIESLSNKLLTDFAEFQDEAKTVKTDVIGRLRVRWDTIKQVEAKNEIQKQEAIQLEIEKKQLEKEKAEAAKAEIKVNKTKKLAEARIAAKEAEAEARIKKLEDNAQTRINAMNDRLAKNHNKDQAIVDEDRGIITDLPPLMSQEEIEESLRQSAQKTFKIPAFGSQEEEPSTEDPDKVTTLALQNETGMGTRMACVVLNAVRDGKIPYLIWVQ